MKCYDCGFEGCVCVTDPLLEDEEASDYLDISKDMKRLWLPETKKVKNAKV